MHTTVVYMYLHSYKMNILIFNLNILNIKRNLHVKYINHCICYSIFKILYIGKGKIGMRYELGTEELRCTSLCTTTMHIELFACMYVFIACYYELLMLIYCEL